MPGRALDLSQPNAVQASAVWAYGRSRSDEVAAFLLEHWSEFQGEARAAAGEALTADDARAKLLVQALQAGSVQPWMLESHQRNRLIMHRDSELRERARAELGEAFDLRAYHAFVLKTGAVPLDLLEERAEAWIEQQRR